MCRYHRQKQGTASDKRHNFWGSRQCTSLHRPRITSSRWQAWLSANVYVWFRAWSGKLHDQPARSPARQRSHSIVARGAWWDQRSCTDVESIQRIWAGSPFSHCAVVRHRCGLLLIAVVRHLFALKFALKFVASWGNCVHVQLQIYDRYMLLSCFEVQTVALILSHLNKWQGWIWPSFVLLQAK